MFERKHHRRIEQVLRSLRIEVLAAHGCLFGGGTAIALFHGEYRESVDIDFLVSDVQGYRGLRQLLTGPEGLRPLLQDSVAVELPRETRADQYGIRTLVRVDGAGIKFEIVREARIELEPPSPADQVCGVPTLTALDRAASKLLANADRWADDGVFSRDLIDLAMMAPPPALLARAIAKAEQAYGDSVRSSLGKAIEALRRRPQRLADCVQALRMDAVTRAQLAQRIRNLERNAR